MGNTQVHPNYLTKSSRDEVEAYVRGTLLKLMDDETWGIQKIYQTNIAPGEPRLGCRQSNPVSVQLVAQHEYMVSTALLDVIEIVDLQPCACPVP